MISEVGQWLARIVAVLPELMGLWSAARTRDPAAELAAQLDLTRAIKDQQAREEISGA